MASSTGGYVIIEQKTILVAYLAVTFIPILMASFGVFKVIDRLSIRQVVLDRCNSDFVGNDLGLFICWAVKLPTLVAR